ADSQETINYSKVYSPKIFKLDLPKKPNIKIVLTGAGDADFIDALKDKLTLSLNRVKKDQVEIIEAAIEEAIVNYHSMIWPLYASQRDRPLAELLIGIRASDGFSLLHANGPIIKKAKQVQCVGIGEDFCIYQLHRLLRWRDRTERATPIAVYCLSLTK